MSTLRKDLAKGEGKLIDKQLEEEEASSTEFYLMPLLNSPITQNPLYAGGVGILQNIKKRIRVNDIAYTTGATGGHCVIGILRTPQDCLKIINDSVYEFDKLVKMKDF